MVESDEETVAAVAAFIDAFYDPDAAEQTTSESVNSEVSSSPIDSHEDVERALEKRKRNHKGPNDAREHQRQELQNLREEEKALRAKLMLLVMNKLSRSSQKGNMRDDRALVAMWKDITTRQRRRRRIVEAENTRLRERVQEQRRVIENLQLMLASQLVETSNPKDPLYSPAWKAICANDDPGNRTRVLAELASQLREQYNATDAWVKESRRLGDHSSPYVVSRMTVVSATQVAVETVNSRRVPFNYRVAGDLHWAKGNNYVCQVMDYFNEQVVVDSNETVLTAKAFSDEGDPDSSRGIRLRTYAASQKFVDKDRVAIVNASRSESVHVRHKSLPDLTVEERYWMVFYASETNPDDACYVLSASRVILDLESRLADVPHAVGDLFEYFSSRSHLYMDLGLESLEDWILGEANS
ncbi:hypothetical protein Poli38472_007558 [Pythium oligandrum]|uniref:Uncharacterized protein n=1 Tax=Pythium oligandrum TaxID=41045 RepID=A0A8K1CSK4_PYTOL|nr:hypothetical protein Poli38472_007558 [Pythium oligandrum]|eukprot:TMW67886.1 hypothetical protein Poli38472_007558 [Pythium oligandrum]